MTDAATARNQRKIAVIGLGSMGLGMATSPVRASRSAVVTARPPHWRQPRRLVSPPRPTPGEASRVVNAMQTEAVLFGPGGAVPALRKGGITISCATMAPADTRGFAAAAAVERGRARADAWGSGIQPRSPFGFLNCEKAARETWR
jgi:L-threonate 2-dehydrogenase